MSFLQQAKEIVDAKITASAAVSVSGASTVAFDFVMLKDYTEFAVLALSGIAALLSICWAVQRFYDRYKYGPDINSK